MIAFTTKSASASRIPSRILTPSLVVMLGSSPARAGLELCRHMLTISREDCRRVALVHIDTDEEPNELIAFHKENEGMFRTFRLPIAVPVGINHAPLPIKPWHTYIPSKMPQYFANGAGGIRNNGHVAAAFDHQKIIQTLESAIQHLELLGTEQGEKHVRGIQANIVAFLGGGTGSGMLGDITIIVRQLLLERQYQQRINLFCMLPDWIQGTSNNDINWRKSNATACLLELIALSLVADTQPDRVYRKYVLNKVYDVTADPIASEVYLIGRTAMGNADDTARIVGLDLFQRITNASGVGALEHSTWMNRRSLGATDDRGLPTMFATSCPLEARFPVRETARAFARIAASYLLPHMAGIQPPPIAVDATEREKWLDDWREIAELLDDTKGKPLAVKKPDAFEVSAFEDMSSDALDSQWAELRRRQKITTNIIATTIQQKRQMEMGRINQVPRSNSSDQGSPLTKRIIHLQLLEEEYTLVLNTLSEGQLDEEPERPPARRSTFYSIPFLGNWLKTRHAEDTCSEYNDILMSRIEQVRYNLLRESVRDLLAQVQARLQDALRWIQFKDTNLNEQCEDLLTAGLTSPAWQGKLDLPHPHQRHLFDIQSLQDPRTGQSIATERLFMRITFPLLDSDNNGSNVSELRFNEAQVRKNIALFNDRCMNYLNSGRFDPGIDGQSNANLETQSKDRFADRVVDFFYTYYIDKLQPMNLFHLLRLVSGQDRNTTVGSYQMAGDYLLELLLHIKGLVRDLIAFQETLWPEGPGRLDTSLFLSLHIDDGNQKRELDQVVSKLGALTDRNQTPQVESMNDLHRLQVAYGQHGISLATIPEFYRDSNSAMAEYIRHQGEWYGNEQNAFLPDPSQHDYGRNKMPVHSSGEMERLVCDPFALGYQASQPHAKRYNTNLIGRVIREAPGLGNKPEWNV